MTQRCEQSRFSTIPPSLGERYASRALSCLAMPRNLVVTLAAQPVVEEDSPASVLMPEHVTPQWRCSSWP